MRGFLLVLGALGVLAQSPVAAQGADDALSWLGRIASAGQRLNYAGTFTYQSGKNLETSRIVHITDTTGEHERLEVLDGSPREVIRNSKEVRCVLPEQRTVIIDRPGLKRAFPSRLPASFAGLAENYRIRRGEMGRVAGLDAQQIVLEPQDDLRYGYQLWAEVQSGLLLKVRTVDERGDVIEQFSFSEVRIGGDIGREALRPRFNKDAHWRVVHAGGVELPREESGWMQQSPVAGFSLVSVLRRPMGREQGEALHLVFSDGLASISVFVEPASPDGSSHGVGPLSSGAINIYKRQVGPHMITALGEVPLRTVQRLADGMVPVAR